MKANRVLLIGYVGQDLAAVTSKSGTKRVSIRMATHYRKKNEQGEKVVHTIWHDVVAWDRVAAFAERSFVKGSRILVEGDIEYRTFPDNAGHIRYITRIRAESLMNLDR